MNGVVPGGSVSLPMVPVCFLRKEDGTGLRSSLRCPKVLPSPYSVCACRPCANSPPRLAPCMFFYGYDGLGSSVVAEGGAGRLDGGRELGFVEGLLGRRHVLLGNYVVDRLFHFLLSFIYNLHPSNMLHFSGRP